MDLRSLLVSCSPHGSAVSAVRAWGLTRAGTALASGPGVPWSSKGSKTCGQGAKHVAKEQGGSREGLLQQLELNGDVVFSPLGSSGPCAPSRATPQEPCPCLRGAGQSLCAPSAAPVVDLAPCPERREHGRAPLTPRQRAAPAAAERDRVFQAWLNKAPVF